MRYLIILLALVASTACSTAQTHHHHKTLYENCTRINKHGHLVWKRYGTIDYCMAEKRTAHLEKRIRNSQTSDELWGSFVTFGQAISRRNQGPLAHSGDLFCMNDNFGNNEQCNFSSMSACLQQASYTPGNNCYKKQ